MAARVELLYWAARSAMPAPCLTRELPTRPPHLLAAALLLSGCGAEDSPAAALRLRFPAQADTVLSARDAFAPALDGFRLARSEPGGVWVRAARLEVELPREGSAPIRFRRANGDEIRVRELGAAGEARVAERAVSYRRAGGTSFWTATDHGVEEWLLLDEGVARGGEAVAAWHVEGAALRLRGEAVELLDEESGAPVLRVTAPRAHAASGREVAPALRVRGARIELVVDAGGEAVLVDPAWALTGERSAARTEHTATLLLPSGKVLIVGGRAADGAFLGTAELYDPTDDTWTPAAPMITARVDHTATRLPDGRVLVAGGIAELASLDTAELYDPEDDVWTHAAPMKASRANHTATLLSDGRVLVAGGVSRVRTPGNPARREPLAGAELYDPRTDAWSTAASMSVARSSHAATLLLPNGEVLVAGGAWSSSIDTAEVYDAVADSWRSTGPMRTGDDDCPITLTRLLNGEVLATGTWSAERYDPTAGAWTPASDPLLTRGGHTATLLHNGMVLVAGIGCAEDVISNTAELYDPAANTWTLTPPPNALQDEHTATQLLSGDVLLVGPSPFAERYTILGAACASDADCGLAVCVEGICCASRCSEPCHTCASPTSLGRCVAQPRGWDLRGECSRVGCDGSCDGRGACSAVPRGDTCLPAQCSDETHSMRRVVCLADGARCASPDSQAREIVDCAPYRCDQASGSCKDTCSSLHDCAPGTACNLSGHCVRPPPPSIAGCSVGRAAATAASWRTCLGAIALALLAATRRRAPVSRGESTPRRKDS
ncbi:kelch repeat-containing protein [Sorangium sp. So ce1036]|uniref:Kelch repeat-containing protein n=1 Tax=Sorangium sp. So ce1036 TaxID=3133328 RepID=UPI003EFBB802